MRSGLRRSATMAVPHPAAKRPGGLKSEGLLYHARVCARPIRLFPARGRGHFERAGLEQARGLDDGWAMRVLLIEDNGRLAELMVAGLGRRGFVCDHAASLAMASEAIVAQVHDVLIVDRGLPDGEGIAWLKQIRRMGHMQPALILTAWDALEDRISGLDAGADDYVVKPAEIDEIAARIRALLRRPGPRGQVGLHFGPLRFDAAARLAHCHDQQLALSRREADLLELLLRHAGAVVRRESIESALYSFAEPVTPNAVEATVSRLRRKLEEAGAKAMLHTVRGVGYMLRAAAE